METCQAVRADGTRCRGRPRPSGFCFAHDPALQASRRAGAARGGRHKATASRLEHLTPASLRPLLEKFIAAVDAVEAGSLGAKEASAMAALGSVILKFYEAGQQEAVLAALVARLDALERGRAS